MIIEESDFRLENSSDFSQFWDLELLYTVKPKSGEARQEFKNSGYGLTLESAIKRVINYRLSNKKEIYTLKEYLEEYKAENDKIRRLVQPKPASENITNSQT